MGKDVAKGPRGWSGLMAAVDAAIEITRRSGILNIRVARITKLKDGEDGKEHSFQLELVELGKDEDGDAMISCVVKYADNLPPITKPLHRGKWEKSIIAAI